MISNKSQIQNLSNKKVFLAPLKCARIKQVSRSLREKKTGKHLKKDRFVDFIDCHYIKLLFQKSAKWP